MRTIVHPGPGLRIVMLAGLSAIAVPAALLQGQEQRRTGAEQRRTGATASQPTLTLHQALATARRVSPELTAAREAVAAAAARERQAGAFPNPTLSYQREQTSAEGQTNSQNIASVDQPIELGGTRGARVEVAGYRRELAEARLADAQARLDHDVTRAYALAVAAGRRAALAEEAANAFGRARTVSQARLVQGDVSGYSHRRIRLEAARYAGLLAEALLEHRTSRLALASLIAPSTDSTTSIRDAGLVLEDSLVAAKVVISDDSLLAMAGRHRAELRIATLEAEATAAEVRLVARERLPMPTLTAGFKNEEVVGGEGFSGFVAGISLPLPLWDRRRGAIEAAGAESRRRVAEVEIARRRIAREVVAAAEALRAVDEQLDLLRPQLGAESQAALRAAQVAYSEGEIALVEWLDAVRAYQEAEATFASLRAESLIRHAALERAVGLSLARESR